MNNSIYEVTVKATGEKLKVYSVKKPKGGWYDYDSMGSNMPPSAPIAGKKLFTADELIGLPKNKL